MAVTLRLTRTGRKNWPSYRIVVAEHTRPRDGRFLEVIGHYNPRVNPVELTLKEESVKAWIAKGANPSRMVRDLIRKKIPGYIESLEKTRLDKLQAQRKARKERAKKAGGGTAKVSAKKSAKTKK